MVTCRVRMETIRAQHFLTASLDTMAGLVTLADARDVPEGASVRCWDVDFPVGSVLSRPGLSSFYTYTSTLQITGYILRYGIATFTYIGSEPTINEGFLLSGFTGNQSYLNGLEVFVETAGMTTFTAAVAHADDGPISGLTATGVSTSGTFIGPNLGSSTTLIPLPNQNPWVNLSGVLGNTSYTSVVNTALSQTSQSLNIQQFNFVAPLTGGISGIIVTFVARTSSNTTLEVQLLKAGIPIGNTKTVILNPTDTTVILGGSSDEWGTTWVSADINNTTFGVRITALGIGTTFVKDLDISVNLIPALENFNWIGSYEQSNMALTTLALDAAGNMWKEDVINTPGVLSLALTGILPGSFANGSTMNNSEFVMFSDLSIGTDRPRQLFSDGKWYPVTQVGPGAPPSFQANIGSVAGIITLSSYAQSGQTVTFQYTPPGSEPSAGTVLVLSAPGTFLDKQVVTVLSSGLSTTQFEAIVTGGVPVGSTNFTVTSTATPSFAYPIKSITQPSAFSYMLPGGLIFVLSANYTGGGPGTNVTVYYNIYGDPGDNTLIKDVQSGNAVYVEITGASSGSYNFNGIWLVTSVGSHYRPGTQNTGAYFTFTFTTSGDVVVGAIAGSAYRETIATIVTSTPIPSLSAGSSITITGATPSGWNGTWTIVSAVNGGSYNITSTALVASTQVATYGYSFAGQTVVPPTAGSLITIINCTNNAIFNGTYTIATVNVGNGTFTVNNISNTADIVQETENKGQATEFGTTFTFDPGEKYQGTTTNVIYGNDTSTGNIAVIGSSLVPIGAGTRQAMVFFITATGAWTPASPPVTFTVASNANELLVSSIPIGLSDVVGRGIAVTEAGANGVPGANFYVITEPVINTVEGVTTTYTSTIINDNTSTTAAFSFTDAVLLNSQEVDIPAFNLFNLIELGSSGWCVPYSSRMFYGLQLNKVQNFNNLSFDGGSLLEGWGQYPTNTGLVTSEISLLSSPVTGDALYIINNTGSTQAQMGMIAQTAYQDPYKVAIINSNVAYSVRVACSCPSGVRLGTLVIDLTDLSNSLFGNTYGSFTVPFSSMTSVVSTFSGTLLAQNVFPGSVSSKLNLRVWVQNMGVGANVLVDRIEVFPTLFPYLKTQVYGSYINKPEWVDASGDGGILDTSTENPQPCFGGFVMRDSLYLAKTNSLYVTKDNPSAEPGGWSLNEVSSKVGACGINAYDVGDEWALLACRSGIFGFSGTEPVLLTTEIRQIWDAINWSAGNTIVLRNDVNNRRIYCAIPLPTGTSPAGFL